MKQCVDCKKLGVGPKPLDAFNKNARSKDGKATYCSQHAAQRLRGYYEQSGSKYNEQKKVWRKENPVAARTLDVRKYLKATYGLSEKQYAEIYERQYGGCAICYASLISQLDETREFTKRKKISGVAYVDHDHETGAVRGFLCFACNIILGKAKEDENILLNAVGYLRASATPQARPAAERESVSAIEPGKKARDLDSSISRGNRRQELYPFFN